MPFGLKNVSVTYQRLVNRMFKEKISRNIYVDDLLVKSKESKQRIVDLWEAFDILRQYKIKLNPTKCTFGMGSGKLLGFMVLERGVEASLEKI